MCHNMHGNKKLPLKMEKLSDILLLSMVWKPLKTFWYFYYQWFENNYQLFHIFRNITDNDKNIDKLFQMSLSYFLLFSRAYRKAKRFSDRGRMLMQIH